MAEVKSKPAIKKRKLQDHAISHIALAIAAKAFEHKFADLHERCKPIDEDIYLAMFGMKSVAQIEEASKTWPEVLFTRGTDLHIYLRLKSDSCCGWKLRFGEEQRVIPHTPYHTRTYVTPKPSLDARIVAWREELERLSAGRNKLQIELMPQLKALGDTHSVIAYWPEVEPILASFYNETVPDRSIVVTPLAALLGKHLMALPAPEAA